MRPGKNIEKIIRKFDVDVNPRKDQEHLGKILQTHKQLREAGRDSFWLNICSVVATSRITQVAASLIVLSAICLLTLSHRDAIEQYEVSGPETVARYKTPSELVSFAAINMAFRDGGMQAVEEQFDKAAKKVKAGLNERLTVEELICELNECRDSVKGEIL
jgi:hypothetical protein